MKHLSQRAAVSQNDAIVKSNFSISVGKIKY